MPEGDSLYRFAARLRAVLEGRRLEAARAHGPGPVPRVEKIVGATITSVISRGKNLLITFDNGLALRGHLRMYGTWHIYQPGQEWVRPEREARLVLEVPGAVVVNFNAPVIELLEARALGLHLPLRRLGPDVLDDNFDAEECLRRMRAPARASLTLGDAIMDQQVMAGVGNVWKHESLFACGLNPWRLVSEVDDASLRALIDRARDLLRASVGKSNGLGTARRPSMFVYGRAGQPCRRCHTRISSGVQGVDIRYTAWCPRCQPVVEGQAILPPRYRLPVAATASSPRVRR